MAGMQLIPLLQEQREFRMPEINQIVVNRDFIGLGKELEEKRRERRIADEQSRSLESHVQSLEREHKKTVKEINRKHRLMQDMLELRQRQDEQRQFRQKMKRLKEEQLKSLHHRALEERGIHQKNKQQAFQQILELNRNSFVQGRTNRRAREQAKAVNKKVDLSQKQEIVEQVTNMKQAGRLSVVRYKKQRNQEYIDEYKRRMGFENLKKSWKVDFMNSLEEREHELIEKLQKSNQVHEQLQKSFEKKNEMDLRELQSCLMGGTLETKTSRASSIRSGSDFKRSLLQGRSRDRLDIDQYLRNKQIFSTTMQLALSRQKKDQSNQISTKDIDATPTPLSRSHSPEANNNKEAPGNTSMLTKPWGVDIEEAIQSNSQDNLDEDEQHQSTQRRHKRKRNLHANRYKNYEIF